MRSIARSTRWRKPPLRRQSSGRSKLVELALEVEVELAARLVELGRRLQHPRRDPLGEVDEQLVGVLVRQPDPDQPARRLRQQQRPEGRVGGRVGDVEQALLGGPRREPVDGRCRSRLHASSFLSRFSPSCRLRRAASGEQPRAAAISAWGRSLP